MSAQTYTFNSDAIREGDVNIEESKHQKPEILIAAKQIALYAFVRTSPSHSNIQPLKKIRDWLLDGGHKMYKVNDVEKVQEWLKTNNLTETSDITLAQAIRLVLQFWPVDKIKQYVLLLDKSPIGKPYKWFFFMMGSSDSGSKNEGSDNDSEADVKEGDEGEEDEEEEEVETTQGLKEFREVQKDFKAKEERLINNAALKIHQTVVVAKSYMEPNIKKQEFLEKFELQILKAVKEQASNFMFYYTGYGKHDDSDEHNGALVVKPQDGKDEKSDGLIYMSDFLNIIQNSGFKGGVEMSIDSSFSGNLCYKAKEWFDNQKQEQIHFHLKVYSLTHKSKKCTWGAYRKMKEKFYKFKVSDPSNADSMSILKEYEQKYGLTEFDSVVDKKDPIQALYAIKESYPDKYETTKLEFMKRLRNTVSLGDFYAQWEEFKKAHKTQSEDTIDQEEKN